MRWFLLLFSFLGLAACQTDPVRKLAPLEQVKPQLKAQLIWQTGAGGTFRQDIQNLTPVIQPGLVYVATPSGTLQAMPVPQQPSVNQGRQVKWQVKVPGTPLSGPSLINHQLVLGTAEGQLLAYDLQGQQKWQLQLTSEVVSPIQFIQGLIFVRTQDGVLWALTPEGTIQWQVDHHLPELFVRGFAPVTPVGQDILVGWPDGTLMRLDAQTSQVIWQVKLAYPRGRSDVERMVDIHVAPVVEGNQAFVLLVNRQLVAVNLTTGEKLWQKHYSGYLPLVMDKAGLVLMDTANRLIKLKFTGTLLWQNDDLKGRYVTSLSADSNTLVAADAIGQLHFFSLKTGERLFSRMHAQSPDGEGKPIGFMKLKGRYLWVFDQDADISLYKITPFAP